jgi:hypothetical protein
MDTTTQEMRINLDEIDDAATAAATKNGKIEVKTADEPVIDVADGAKDTKIDDSKVVDPEEGLKKLQKQLEDEKSARIAAEASAQEAREAEARARGETQGTQLDLVTNAIATVTQANDALEAKYAESLAAQDFATAAKINREMGANSAKLLQLEQGKQQLERAPKPTARAPTDPVDRFVSTLTPKSAAWVRAHADYARDPSKTAEMIGAHNMVMARAKARGIDAKVYVDSDDYFRSIEKALEMEPAAARTDANTKQDDDAMSDAAKPAPRKSPPAAAPVSRSGTTNGQRSNVVTLSADEREMARMMFPESKDPDREYALNKVALQKEGRLN